MTFKDQLKSDLIPRIEEMIRKEEEHLHHLQEYYVNQDFDFVISLFSEERKFISKAICISKRMLAHYKTRLKQYREYSQK